MASFFSLLAIFFSIGLSTELYAVDNLSMAENNQHQAWVEGNRLIEENEYDKAIIYFDKILSERPNSWEAWHAKGVALIFLGKNEQALECLDNALKLNSNHILSLSSRGNTNLKLGRYKEAFSDLKRAVELDEQFYPAHYHLGNAWLVSGEYKKALIRYQFATRINDKPQELWYRIGYVLSKLDRHEDAVKAFEKALKRKPWYGNYESDIWFEKGFSLHQLERYFEAEQCYINAYKLDKNWDVAFYNLACIYSKQKKWDESFAALLRYYQMSSSDPSEVYEEDDLRGLVKHPLYIKKIKDLGTKKRVENE